MAGASAASGGVLDRVDVVVGGDGIWGQLTGTYLAELGARVFRVEPPEGDSLRRARWGAGPADSAWAVAARGGRSVTCDLGTPAGVERARRIVGAADVVIDGEAGRWLDRVGRASSVVPPVVVRVSALDDGASAGPGDGLLAAAAGGLLHLTGHPQSTPVRVGSDVVEHLTAAFAAQAVLGGVLARTAGQDRVLEARVSGEAAVRRVLEWTLVAYSSSGRIRVREGNRPSAVAPLGLYRTADGALVAVVGASDANFRRLVVAMQRPGLLEDPRFSTVTARAEHSVAVNGEVAAWAAHLPLADVVARCRDAGVLVGPVQRVQDLLLDPHVEARGELTDWPMPDGSSAPQPTPQPLSRLLADHQLPAPALGEADTDVWSALTESDRVPWA